jgi:hypothetical protein
MSLGEMKLGETSLLFFKGNVVRGKNIVPLNRNWTYTEGSI